MTDVSIDMRRSDLWTAARQEAFRWQGYLARLPLFLVIALALFGILFGAGIGFLRGVQELSIPLQGLVFIGYSVVYWISFALGRLIQGWLRSRRMAQALFGAEEEATVYLSLGDISLHLNVGEWETTIPRPQAYMTQDFVFLNTPLVPWIPIRRSVEVNQLIDLMRKPVKKKGAEKTPSHLEISDEA